MQRRDDVRGVVDLPLRGTATSGPAVGGLRGELPGVALHGHTVDISAGGLRAEVQLDAAGGGMHELPEGLRDLFVELDSAGARPIGAVLRVVRLRSGLLGARFLIISPADRDYVASLVFAQQRAILANRREAPATAARAAPGRAPASVACSASSAS